MSRNLTIETVGRCISKPPFFDGTNYSDWKEDIKIFIQSVDFRLWLIIKNGPTIPIEEEKSEERFTDEEMNNVKQDSKAKYILCCAVNSRDYSKISRLRTAKNMWDILENRYGNMDRNSSSHQQTSQATPICNVFFEEKREAMDGYLKKCVPLYKYALQGNWKEAKGIINGDNRLKNAAIDERLGTVLHIAAGAGGGAKHVRFTQQLMETYLSEKDLLLRNNKENTAFCLAAAAGNMEVVKMMLKTNQSVLEVRGGNGQCPPVQLAAMKGKCRMACYLYQRSDQQLTTEELAQLFFTCINTGIYGLALEMVTKHPVLAFEKDSNNGNATALHLLARSRVDSCCQSPQHESTEVPINPALRQNVVFQLVNKLWSTILEEKSKAKISDIIKEPFHLLFAAVEVGNFGFVSELISAYPCLIWEVDREGQTILHKAVRHRHASIFSLIHEIGFAKDIIVTMVDTKGNTLLHLAAKRAPQSRLELVSGVAFQTCLELVWFKEVKKIMPPAFINFENCDGLTANELFSREHAELRKEAECWMKSTAENCMLIATVIATGVFAAAINIPDGSHDHKSAFLVFAISDAAAFITSVAAILIFLSILVSRYAEYDFYISLPWKLILGLVALFCSITSMMVAFASAFFITYHKHGSNNQVPIFISAFAFLPILLFLILVHPLCLDIMYPVVICRNYFKPSKKMLYVLKNNEDVNCQNSLWGLLTRNRLNEDLENPQENRDPPHA